jgi:hypothetical protein
MKEQGTSIENQRDIRPLGLEVILSIVTQFAIRLGTWYGFGYAVLKFQRIWTGDVL